MSVSYPASQALGYAELAAQVEASLPIHRPFYLLAESFSGPIAITIASRHPDTCLGLILCASFARDPVGSVGRWLPEFLYPLLAAAARSNKLASVRDWCLLGSFRTVAVSQRLSTCISRLSSEVFVKRMEEAIRVDATEALRVCQCPILVLQATHDPLVRKASTEQLRRIRPDASWIQVEAPHLLLQTNPAAAATAITAWLDELPTEHSDHNLL